MRQPFDHLAYLPDGAAAAHLERERPRALERARALRAAAVTRTANAPERAKREHQEIGGYVYHC